MGTKCWAFSFVKCSADVWNHLSDDAFKTQLNSSIHLIFIIFVRFFTLKTYKPMTQQHQQLAATLLSLSTAFNCLAEHCVAVAFCSIHWTTYWQNISSLSLFTSINNKLK